MSSGILFVLLAFFGFGRVEAPSDAAMLNRVHRALAAPNDKKAWFIRFEQLVKPADAQRARVLLPTLKPNSRAFAELSFVQAYYGVNLPASLDRVQRPILLGKSNYKQWEIEYREAEQSYPDIRMQEFFDFNLNLLYLKRHDPQILGRWLDLQIRGALAEANSSGLAEFWVRHKGEMIRVASLKSSRIKLLAKNLAFERFVDSDHASNAYFLKKRRQFFAEVAPYTRDKNPKTAQAARALQQAFLQEEANYRKLE